MLKKATFSDKQDKYKSYVAPDPLNPDFGGSFNVKRKVNAVDGNSRPFGGGGG
jgi:hypothetical protein